MILGIGIDVIEIERFNRPESPRFWARCYTPPERAYMEGKGAQTAAGLFAAKEAVVKALGTGFRGFWPCEVEILHDEAGKPFAVLHNAAGRLLAERNGKESAVIWVSITHDKNTAAAVAVIEAE